MSHSRDAMIDALKGVVVPALRSRGFSGSFPHLRRPAAERIDLLTFQFDRNGGGFVIEVARCPLEGVPPPWGEKVPPNKGLVCSGRGSRRCAAGIIRRGSGPP